MRVTNLGAKNISKYQKKEMNIERGCSVDDAIYCVSKFGERKRRDVLFVSASNFDDA